MTELNYLMEVPSEQGAGSDGENPSDGSCDSENTSDNGGRVKVGVKAALAGMSYDFGQSTMMKARATSLKSFALPSERIRSASWRRVYSRSSGK
jgi:hypothetical protein